MSVLIFDQLNDIVYLRSDDKFDNNIRDMAVSQGLMDAKVS